MSVSNNKPEGNCMSQPLWEQLVKTSGAQPTTTKHKLALNAEMLSHEAFRKIQPLGDQHSHPMLGFLFVSNKSTGARRRIDSNTRKWLS